MTAVLFIVLLAAVLLLFIVLFLACVNVVFKPKNDKYWHVSDKPKQDETEQEN
jgi:hypothetical protein